MVRLENHLRRLLACAIIGLTALTTSVSATLSDLLWQPYVDPVLGYSILYPAGLFDLPPVHEHGGITLTSRGGAKLFIFGGPNPQGRPLTTAAAQLSRADDVYQVTYRQLGQTWLVLSGFLTDGGAPQSIFYERIDLARDRQTLAGFRLVYAPGQRAMFDPIIATIGNSLRSPISGLALLAPPSYQPAPNAGSAGVTHQEWCRRKYSTYDATTDSFLRFDGQRMPCQGSRE
jgi:hypothetical protein